MSLNILHLNQTPIYEQLQIEEALLRADNRNWCIVNQGSPPAIVMGISGKIDDVIQKSIYNQTPVTVIRRFSGGGSVFIDENTLFITFICNTSFIPIQPYPQHIMQWTETIYRPIFDPHPFQLHENDYVLGENKFGGNAQSICKNRWLHHSSLLWDFCPLKMQYLQFPKKFPAYRQNRSHEEFLCKLGSIWPNKSDFWAKFFAQLNFKFTINEVKKEEIERILNIPHRKATTFIKVNEVK